MQPVAARARASVLMFGRSVPERQHKRVPPRQNTRGHTASDAFRWSQRCCQDAPSDLPPENTAQMFTVNSTTNFHLPWVLPAGNYPSPRLPPSGPVPPAQTAAVPAAGPGSVPSHSPAASSPALPRTETCPREAQRAPPERVLPYIDKNRCEPLHGPRPACRRRRAKLGHARRRSRRVLPTRARDTIHHTTITTTSSRRNRMVDNQTRPQ